MSLSPKHKPWYNIAMTKKEGYRSRTMVAKYLREKEKGLTKKQAALNAGYKLSVAKAPSLIERSETYKEVESLYKNIILKKLSLETLADEHIKNIIQDEDRGAKNTAIKMALDKIEPVNSNLADDDDRVTVILRGKINL